MYLSKRYLVTSALPYANGPLHIGHLAGAYLPADVYVRFLRLMGKDVVYICGSDEHGAAITIRASAENKSPKEIVDTYHQLFVEAFREMGISFDIYHRTSEPIHHKTSQEFFTRLYENGEFIEKETKQYFDKKSGKFLADRYITGTCPKCGHDEAYGDQCEKCGSSLSPTDLINPRSTLTGEKPVLKKTKHWYLSLDKHEQWLREWLTNGKLDGEEVHDPSNWKNHVIGQCKSWLDAGLQPRAMTRDLDWGVDVPKEITGSEGKKLYVWMDAPIGYISATKQWAIDHKKDWKPYWQDKETALIHFIGKDNIVFHCLIFPAILKAHGDYILPKNVPANQFVNLENRKISTSKNWAVWVNEYVRDFEGHEDELRYHLIKNMPEQKDSEFTWQGYQDSVNNELVNNLANFINRVLVLTHKFYKGVVPDFDPDQPLTGSGDEDFGVFHDTEMLQLFDDLSDLCQYIRDFDFRASLKTLMEISAKGNQLLQFNEPWKEIKENPEMVKALMNLSMQIVTALSMAMRPFMPFTSDKLRELLNLEKLSENGEFEEMLNELAEGNLIIPAGHKINPARHLFVKVDDEKIAEQVQKLKEGEKVETISKAEENHVKKTIQYNDFDKIDIRTATILEAEKVPGTDKLMKLVIDLGFEKRTVISGIATQFKTKDVIGKKVTYLANLASRKIRGIKSEGMILFAEDGDGKLSFIQPEEELSDGSVVR